MPNKGESITPHKGGRTERRLVLMTPEIKHMTDYVLKELSHRSDDRVSMSDVWETRIRYLYQWLKENPGLPLNYAGRIHVKTGKTGVLPSLPPDE